MPVLDGIAAVKEIRRKNSSIPIIGLSGLFVIIWMEYAGESDELEIARFCGAGADMVLLKPLKITELKLHLRTLIK